MDTQPDCVSELHGALAAADEEQQPDGGKAHKNAAGGKVVASKLTNREKGALFMVVALPLLFLNGYFYFYGYLAAFGASADFFPRSLEQQLTSAFLAYFEFVTLALPGYMKKQPYFAAFAVFMTVFAVFLTWWMRSGRDAWLQRRLERMKQTAVYDYIGRPSFVGSLIFLGMQIPLLVAVCFLIPIWPYSVGYQSGAKEVAAFATCEQLAMNTNKRCAYLYENGVLIASGLLVVGSDTRVALYTEAGSTTVYSLTDSRTVERATRVTREKRVENAPTNNEPSGLEGSTK